MTQEENAKALMRVPAIACNNVEWSASNFGVRLTFGEKHIIEGEPPEHRVTVFLPWQIIEAMTTVLDATIKDFKQKQELARHIGVLEPEQKPN